MFLMRNSLGTLFGASSEVDIEIAKITPIFLVSVPFNFYRTCFYAGPHADPAASVRRSDHDLVEYGKRKDFVRALSFIIKTARR